MVGAIVHHHWFVVDRNGEQARWEVWQRADAGRESWGHVHRNLMAPDSGVGNGPSWVLHSWDGEDAEDLAVRLERAVDEYPWRARYRYWPGPNSNTYVQWVLGERFALPWKAFGKHYARRVVT